jgi:hypothetical protein
MGFTPPVKRASPEPLTEPPTEPRDARPARSDEEIDRQEKSSRKRYSDNQNIIRKSPEIINRELREWQKKQIPYMFSWTWETARSAILDAFEQIYLIAPYPPAVREPRDMWRVDDWEKNSWDPSICVGAVQGALVKKLQEGDPLASLHYVEQRLKAQYRRRRQDDHGAGA